MFAGWRLGFLAGVFVGWWFFVVGCLGCGLWGCVIYVRLVLGGFVGWLFACRCGFVGVALFACMRGRCIEFGVLGCLL